jgi:DNA repair exonuclease SbcCD ATPase subunit
VTEEEIATLQDQLAEAQTEVERLQTIAADREARAAHLEETLAQLREEQSQLSAALSEAQAQLAARDEEVEALQVSLKTAASKYRAAVLASKPEVPPDLVGGETVDEVDHQLETALRMVTQLKSHLESQAQALRVPSGAPARRAPDLSALSPAEKIVYGLSQQQR